MPASGFQDVSNGPRFRNEKKLLLSLLASPDWHERFLQGLSSSENSTEAQALLAKQRVNPVLAMLLRAELRYQAAICLGDAMALCAEHDREFARNIMRRLMWSLNEESGNLGWGSPEAFGAIVSASPMLRQEFERVLASYIMDTGKADNYIDHAPLRLGAYWAVGHAAGSRATAWFQMLPWLLKSLDPQHESDIACSTMCLWTFARTLERARELGEKPGLQDAPLWNRLEAALKSIAPLAEQPDVSVDVFEKGQISAMYRADLRERALAAVQGR